MADSLKKPVDMTDEELARLTQGCTEWTCPYHGEYNRERHRRKHAREVRKEGIGTW